MPARGAARAFSLAYTSVDLPFPTICFGIFRLLDARGAAQVPENGGARQNAPGRSFHFYDTRAAQENQGKKAKGKLLLCNKSFKNTALCVQVALPPEHAMFVSA